jgi:hypothetical protein
MKALQPIALWVNKRIGTTSTQLHISAFIMYLTALKYLKRIDNTCDLSTLLRKDINAQSFRSLSRGAT